jgi:hypothetical protein
MACANTDMLKEKQLVIGLQGHGATKQLEAALNKIRAPLIEAQQLKNTDTTVQLPTSKAQSKAKLCTTTKKD